MTTLFSFSQKINTKFLLGIIFIFSLSIFISCEEEISPLGSNLLPDSDKIDYYYDTTITFNCYVKKADSVFTRSLANYNIGINSDPYFGKFEGRLATQFVPINYVYPFNDTLSIDSLVLYLQIDSTFGNANNTIFNVYELDSAISETYQYYSNYELNNFVPNFKKINTNFRNSGDTLLIFNLNSYFTKKLTSDTSIYEGKDSFLEEIKGVAIVPEGNEEGGKIYNIKLNSKTSRITAHYRTEKEESIIDTLAFNYYFEGLKFGQYKINYEGSELENFLENASQTSDSLFFVQGLGGAYSTIVFHNLDNWRAIKSSILKAELLFPVYETEINSKNFTPKGLYFSYIDNYGNRQQIEDSYGDFFGGIYNSKKNQYTFDISKHFKNLVNQNINDSSLDVRIINNALYPHRIILKGNENIKLKITYTKH